MCIVCGLNYGGRGWDGTTAAVADDAVVAAHIIIYTMIVLLLKYITWQTRDALYHHLSMYIYHSISRYVNVIYSALKAIDVAI